MNLRGLIVAAAVLALLGGLLYWSQRHKAANVNTSANASQAILNIDKPDQVTQLTIKTSAAEPVTLVKAKNGKWQITEPGPLNADQDAVAGVLSTLSALNADRVVENKPSDVKQYGLDSPVVEISIAGNDNKAQQVLLGDDTPTGGDTYAMRAGDPRVFTVAGYDKSSLDKSLNDLRDKRLLPVNAAMVSRVELLRKNQDIEFRRAKGGWQILRPKPLGADDAEVDDLLSSLTNSTMDLSGKGTSDAATEFTRAVPLATAKLTDNAGTQTLEVRKNKDGDDYAKSSAVAGIYKVDSSLAQALDKNLDEFRSQAQAKERAGEPTSGQRKGSK